MFIPPQPNAVFGERRKCPFVQRDRVCAPVKGMGGTAAWALLIAKCIHPQLLALALDVGKVNASVGKWSLNAESFSPEQCGGDGGRAAPAPHLSSLSCLSQPASE